MTLATSNRSASLSLNTPRVIPRSSVTRNQWRSEISSNNIRKHNTGKKHGTHRHTKGHEPNVTGRSGAATASARAHAAAGPAH